MSDESLAFSLAKTHEVGGIDYMLVGSFASNQHGIPRATKDADFVIDTPTDQIEELPSAPSCHPISAASDTAIPTLPVQPHHHRQQSTPRSSSVPDSPVTISSTLLINSPSSQIPPPQR